MAAALDVSRELPFYDIDQDSFNLAMFERQNGTINFGNDRLASLSYNPLLSNTNQQRKLMRDYDPDSYFFADHFTEDQFNDVFKKETHYVSQFSTLHLNIRSLVRNFQKQT